MPSRCRFGYLVVVAVFLLHFCSSTKAKERPEKPLIIEGIDLMIAVSNSGKTVYGFSDVTGEWAKITLEEKEVFKRENITFGRSFAGLISGTHAYAFSNVTGKWSTVLCDGKPGPMILGGDIACFIAGTKAYAFAAQSGTWAQVELGVKGASPRIGKRVQINVGSKVFLFTGSSKEWSVLDLADD